MTKDILQLKSMDGCDPRHQYEHKLGIINKIIYFILDAEACLEFSDWKISASIDGFRLEAIR